MENLVNIHPIAVKDKNDVVKALRILERLGINTMTEEQKEKYLADETKTVDNHFMIQEEDGGFRIQSHYLGFGISLESLEKQVNNIVEIQPDVFERLVEIETRRSELKKELEEKEKKLTEDINEIREYFKQTPQRLNKGEYIREKRNTYAIIEITEEN